MALAGDRGRPDRGRLIQPARVRGLAGCGVARGLHRPGVAGPAGVAQESTSVRGGQPADREHPLGADTHRRRDPAHCQPAFRLCRAPLPHGTQHSDRPGNRRASRDRVRLRVRPGLDLGCGAPLPASHRTGRGGPGAGVASHRPADLYLGADSGGWRPRAERLAPDSGPAGRPIFIGLRRNDQGLFNDAMLYFLTARRPGTVYFEFLPGFSNSEGVQRTVACQLQASGTALAVLGPNSAGEPWNASARTGSSYLDAWLLQHSVQAAEVNGYELLQLDLPEG